MLELRNIFKENFDETFLYIYGEDIPQDIL